MRTLTVEPSFLSNVSRFVFDESDHEMLPLLQLARSSDSAFRVVNRYGLELLYRCPEAGKAEQLVVPKAGGLRRLLMQEVHCSPVGGHFGVKKMMAMLLSRVWWPRMHTEVSRFVAGCHVC